MIKTETYGILARSPIFKGLAPDEIEKQLKRVPHRFVKHKKGHTIALKGDACETLMVIVKGSVKAEMVEFSGKSMEVETIPAPRPIAPAFIFGKNNTFPVDVTTDEETVLLSLPKNSLVILFQENAKVLTNYLDIISSRTHFLTRRLWFMSFKTIKEKFAHYLLSLAKPGATTVTLPKNQQELSEFFGVSRPSLARVIKDLETEQIISHKRREVIIKDREKLKSLLA